MQSGAERAVAALATSQHGAFGTRQAAQRGVTRKVRKGRVQRGQWIEPIAGVVVVAGSPDTWRQRLTIAVLACGGVVSHRAAAALHGLDGFAESVVEVSVVRGRMPRLPGVFVHRVAFLDAQDVTVVDGIPVTNVARTVCDLGAVVSDDRVEQALDDALRREFSQRWIEETLARVERPGPSGTASLRRVLERPDRAGRLPDSKFERLVERLVTAAGLPPPVRQHQVFDECGELIGKIDLAWPDIKLGIEATSLRWHKGPRRGRGDQVRDLRLTAEGWAILYPQWQDTVEPDPFIESALKVYRRLARERPG
jgi:hypothetical protein